MKELLIGYLIVCTTACGVAQAVTPMSPSPQEAIAQVRVLPYKNGLDFIDPEQAPILRAVARLSVKERDKLLRSSDPRERGIGIFIADQQGDIKCLFGLSHLLTDQELTVPHASISVHFPPYLTEPQTVGRYLGDTYLNWFGFPVYSPEEFDRAFREVRDPDLLVSPWIARLLRTRGDARKVTDIKSKIARLPERLRATVIIEGYYVNGYTLREARELLARMSRSIREALARREVLVPDDPRYRGRGNSYALERITPLIQPEPWAGK